MIHFPNENTDAALNLALEEYLLCRSEVKEDILFFYINKPSIIIGQHQNTFCEIDREYVRSHGIDVVRRMSGGGAVYHDLGNLNYSFIHPGDQAASADFAAAAEPILSALRSFGVNASFTGRNDMVVDGAKFSGMAYYHKHQGSVCHGTLLFDADMDVLGKCLLPQPEKLKRKGVNSVRSRVTNLKHYLPQFNDCRELRDAIIDFMRKEYRIKVMAFSPEALETAQNIVAERYRNDNWNWGRSPSYNLHRHFYAPEGMIDFCAVLTNGKLYEPRFFGDYFSSGDVQTIETALEGTVYTANAMRTALIEKWKNIFPLFDLDEYIEGMVH